MTTGKGGRFPLFLLVHLIEGTLGVDYGLAHEVFRFGGLSRGQEFH